MTFPAIVFPSAGPGGSVVKSVSNPLTNPFRCHTIGGYVYIISSNYGAVGPSGVTWVEATTNAFGGFSDFLSLLSGSIRNSAVSGTDIYIWAAMPATGTRLIKFDTITKLFTVVTTFTEDFYGIAVHAGILYRTQDDGGSVYNLTSVALSDIHTVISTTLTTELGPLVVDTLGANYTNGFARVWVGVERFSLAGVGPEGTPIVSTGTVRAIGTGLSTLYMVTSTGRVHSVNPQAQTIALTTDLSADFTEGLQCCVLDSVNSKFMVIGRITTDTLKVGRVSLAGALESSVALPAPTSEEPYVPRIDNLGTIAASKFFVTRSRTVGGVLGDTGEMYSTPLTGALALTEVSQPSLSPAWRAP